MARALPAALAGQPGLWRGRQSAGTATLASGHPRLDRLLPGGGWPLGASVELLTERPGLGEFRLLLPLLARLTGAGQWVLLVDPPWLPYPLALRGHGVALARLLLVRTASPGEALWACEQALRGLRGGLVLAWPPPAVGFAQLRRLQLAAVAGDKTAFLFRAAAAAANPAPAPLRLQLQADAQALQLRVLKARGVRPGATLQLRHPQAGAPGARDGGGEEDLPLPPPSATRPRPATPVGQA